jgi:hypothetical protein
MFNVPSFIFAFVAYRVATMQSTEIIGVGIALMGVVVFQQFLNLVKHNRECGEFEPVAAEGQVATQRNTSIKLDEFSDRPVMSWTGRNPLNPIDTDF